MVYTLLDGRRGSLMFRVLDSRSNGPSSSPGQGHDVVRFSTQEYKWVPAE